MRKVVLSVMLALILLSSLTMAFNVKPAKAWTGTVYIRADGSIDPPDAPIITRDKIIYTLTGNIISSGNGIVVERDNIVIDGAGYTIHGTGIQTGIYLSGRTNVTVKNTQINNFGFGIQLYSSLRNSISGNTITANTGHGIWLEYSLDNIINGNNIANNGGGVGLKYSSDSIISGNNIANSYYGVWLDYSSDNIISGNNIINNNYCGVWLISSSNYNIISGNNITYSAFCGVGLAYSSNNNIIGNKIANTNGTGISLYGSLNNSIIGNEIASSMSNGIYLEYSSNYNVIVGNEIANNNNGIGLGPYSVYNSLADNNITNNAIGVWLYDSSNNEVYHNKFINNAEQVLICKVYIYNLTNVWDDGYPSGGNYWSDYTGVDYYSGPNQDQPGSDGIGDTPYVIDENNVDRYPLMHPWRPFREEINAEIVSVSLTPLGGQVLAGDKVEAKVTVKNTGSKPWTFYVGFSVQDPNGKWWDAPYNTITLNPNEEGTVTLYWTVPSEAPLGYYNARVAVWGGKMGDILTDLLDCRDIMQVFKVISIDELMQDNAKLAEMRAKAYMSYWILMVEIMYGSVDPKWIESIFEELLSLIQDLMDVYTGNILEKLTATYNVIEDINELLDRIGEGIKALIKSINLYPWDWQLEHDLHLLYALCQKEAEYWKSGSVSNIAEVEKIINDELKILTQTKPAAFKYDLSYEGQKLYDSVYDEQGRLRSTIEASWGFRSAVRELRIEREKKQNLLTIAENIVSFIEADSKLLSNIKLPTQRVSSIEITAHSPVNIHIFSESGEHVGAVYDEEGNIIGYEYQIKNVLYIPLLEYARILLEKNETFIIEVVGLEDHAEFNLTIRMFNKYGEPIQEWNGQGILMKRESCNYILHSSIEAFNLLIALEVKIEPETLNLKSKGKWITAYIELPRGYDVGNINATTILLNNTIPVDFGAPTEIGDYDGDGIMDLMVKFNRTLVSEFILSKGIKYGNVTLTISGRLYDGIEFMGSDTIRVRMPEDINMDGRARA